LKHGGSDCHDLFIPPCVSHSLATKLPLALHCALQSASSQRQQAGKEISEFQSHPHEPTDPRTLWSMEVALAFASANVKAELSSLFTS